jgi:hypothetical protein
MGLKVHYHIHNSLPQVPIMSQMNPVHTVPTYFQITILILFSHWHVGLMSSLFLSGFKAKFCAHFLSPPHYLCYMTAWLCAVWRGKGTGHHTPFNSWLSMPHSGGMGCAVCGHVWMQVYVCAHAHLVPALYEDPTSLRAGNCTHTHDPPISSSFIWSP